MASPSDAALIQYLLGYADRGDEEQFDELSVTDAAFAERLRALEHDLADAYVRGELSPPDRERWEARYLASRHGRDDLTIAQALAAHETGGRKSEAGGRVERARTARMRWPLAAAAVLVLAAIGGYQIAHREPPGAPVAPPPAGKAATPANPSPTVTHIAMTLAPSVRSLGSAPTLEIPPGTSAVTLTLRLDPDDHDRYDIALRDLATDTVTWHAEAAPASGTDPNRSLILTIPASTFRSGRYLISVSAGTAGQRETVATYSFTAVLQ